MVVAIVVVWCSVDVVVVVDCAMDATVVCHG
jgi:hypothetical protein